MTTFFWRDSSFFPKTFKRLLERFFFFIVWIPDEAILRGSWVNFERIRGCLIMNNHYQLGISEWICGKALVALLVQLRYVPHCWSCEQVAYAYHISSVSILSLSHNGHRWLRIEVLFSFSYPVSNKFLVCGALFTRNRVMRQFYCPSFEERTLLFTTNGSLARFSLNEIAFVSHVACV